MTEFFTREQIDNIRECFNVYSQDGIVHSAPQLRCILRSLGYSPTAAKTTEYFKNTKRPMDFALFLEIAKEEHNSGDELTEIIKALKGLDRDGTRCIPAKELRSILSSIGERMSQQEIDNVLKHVAVGGMVPHQKLIHLRISAFQISCKSLFALFARTPIMAGNFWQSSHYDQWIFEKQELLRMRSEDLKIYTEEEYQKLMIFWANLIQTLAIEGIQQGHPKTRMQVIATAIVYFKRFYARRSYKDVDPLLIACASVFLASKVEEHGLMSMSNLIKTIPNCLKKWPNLTYDASSKNSGLYDAEFILVEMLDCCLVVYHPYRPLTTMLQDIARDPTVKDFPPFEEQCWKVANDSLRSDCSLLFPPHIIAISCIIVGAELMNREKDIKMWLPELSVDFEKVYDCVNTLFAMYKTWKTFDEKEHRLVLFSLTFGWAARFCDRILFEYNAILCRLTIIHKLPQQSTFSPNRYLRFGFSTNP
ncbi:hypothetical protein RB195_004935 [Necator americanus]|uniref:EF-hand domain-containing protein n=1 Tax=Necator americanus TaxID=51031 RepID=A0ABR1BKF2_NECAM